MLKKANYKTHYVSVFVNNMNFKIAEDEHLSCTVHVRHFLDLLLNSERKSAVLSELQDLKIRNVVNSMLLVHFTLR